MVEYIPQYKGFSMSNKTTIKDPSLVSLGSTGIYTGSGFFDDEDIIRDLSWPYCIKKYQEMETDALIGGILFAINQFIRSSSWSVREYDGDDKPSDSAEQARFLEECFKDLAKPWEEVITDVLSFLTYGFSIHEIVYKKRLGPQQSDKRYKSRYEDGKIGWRKFPIRSQDTIEKFNLDEDSDLISVVQRDVTRGNTVEIPADRLLLFRTTTYKDNPRGKSILRSAYRAYYFRKNIEMIEGIGIERNLAGVPVIKVPGELFDGTEENSRRLQTFERMGRNLKRNDQSYVLLPSDVYGDQSSGSGEAVYSLELLQGSGSANTNQNQTIERWDRRIAQSMLSDFLLTGGQSVGSYSLASTKYDAFKIAIESYLDTIRHQMNEKAIPMLFEINGWSGSTCPTLEHSGISEESLESLGTFLKNISGFVTPDSSIEEMIRERLEVSKVPLDRLTTDDGVIQESRNRLNSELGGRYGNE